MAKVFVFGILILQIYVYAAPSDISKLEDTAIVEEPGPVLDDGQSLIKEIKDNDPSQESVRQKRFYNHYGFGFPPISPVVYTSYGKRDESADTGIYGAEDPFKQINRRLDEISSLLRQPPSQSAPTPPIPIFFPVIYVPQACTCNPVTNNNTPTQKPNTSSPTSNTTSATFTPDVGERGGEKDTDTDDYESDYEDNNRPISFDPIILNATLARPPPPVEHGSSQAGREGNNPTTTTTRPISNAVPAAQRPPSNLYPQAALPASNAPSVCDGAVLSCCHQPQVTYDCFSLQGCPDPTNYGNPCEANVILGVIYKFQNYYGQRNG